jgi:hypothetical protein
VLTIATKRTDLRPGAALIAAPNPARVGGVVRSVRHFKNDSEDGLWRVATALQHSKLFPAMERCGRRCPRGAAAASSWAAKKESDGMTGRLPSWRVTSRGDVQAFALSPCLLIGLPRFQQRSER